MSVYLGSNLVSLQGGLTLAGVVDLLYPIGSIYLSVNNVNPETLFGGTWVAFGAGRALVGVDPNDTDFDTAEETGGEKTHTLVSNEMPKVSGDVCVRRCGTEGETIWTSTGAFSVSMNTGSSNTVGIPTSESSGPKFQKLSMSFGNDEAHNNLQPYITCYMWKRTA